MGFNMQTSSRMLLANIWTKIEADQARRLLWLQVMNLSATGTVYLSTDEVIPGAIGAAPQRYITVSADAAGPVLELGPGIAHAWVRATEPLEINILYKGVV